MLSTTTPKVDWVQRIIALNLTIIALQPVVLLVTLVMADIFPEKLPAWGRGIVLTWGIFPALWFVIGQAESERPPRFRQVGFLATTFAFPLISAALCHESITLALLSIASFNTLGAAVGMGLVLMGGPFFEVKIADMRFQHFRLRPRAEIAKEVSIGWIVLTTFIGGITALPAIAAEWSYFQASEQSLMYWVMRYLSLGPEIFVVYGLILDMSNYKYYEPKPAEPPKQGALAPSSSAPVR